MKNISLDPRVNRMDFSEGENSTETLKPEVDQWETFQVFTQKRRGDQHEHVGIVHAPNNELALVMAKEQYARRGVCVNLWVVPTSAVTATEYTDSDIFDTLPEKTHREAADYKVKGKINKYLASKKQNA